jgi:3-oxoacyl-[acyl-carrier protein] reductase
VAGAARPAGAIAGESFAVGVDVSDEGQVAAAVAAAAERAGAIDALVNCAGIAGPQE